MIYQITISKVEEDYRGYINKEPGEILLNKTPQKYEQIFVANDINSDQAIELLQHLHDLNQSNR